MTQRTWIPLLLLAVAATFVACDRRQPPPPAPKAAETQKQDCDDDQTHGAQGVVELGTSACGEFTVKASRDKHSIKPGCEAPIDVWLTGSAAKVVAVRFWIGTEDAKGSIKARAEIEDPAQPNHWHTHAEIPSPIPTGTKLWVEIETEGDAKSVCSFDLKS